MSGTRQWPGSDCPIRQSPAIKPAWCSGFPYSRLLLDIVQSLANCFVLAVDFFSDPPGPSITGARWVLRSAFVQSFIAQDLTAVKNHSLSSIISVDCLSATWTLRSHDLDLSSKAAWARHYWVPTHFGVR
ncbi:hypothetical protein B0H16DRAFT_1699045 [Mycena metata]|uniref:Uncharacterized protein n=1 Tax=Mycena metata TaxID=1033252 RepID=A0AAD7MMQ8_9AGAR|nr:hypothetical protein B0H16DRAFT_1699045 [Mycena metata]